MCDVMILIVIGIISGLAVSALYALVAVIAASISILGALKDCDSEYATVGTNFEGPAYIAACFMLAIFGYVSGTLDNLTIGKRLIERRKRQFRTR